MYHEIIDTPGPTHTTSQEVVTVQLGDRGRLVVPARIRTRLRLTTGDRFILVIEPDDSIRLVNLRQQAQRLCGMFADVAPGRSLADELIAERRLEAQREDEA
jgi:AbrB family looped-hinge helix DNA binding protein